jgi:diguanylate cyclase (GGDEF)-like protein/PAS domain S-box-containing protein
LPACTGNGNVLEVLVIAWAEERALAICQTLRETDRDLRPRPVADLEAAAGILDNAPGPAALWCLDRLDSGTLRQVESFDARCPGAALVVAVDGKAEIATQSVLLAGAQECLNGAADAGELVRALRSAIARAQAAAGRQAAARRYQSIVSRQNELICRFSAKGDLTFSNPAYRHYFEVANGGSLQGGFFQQMLESDREDVMARLGSLEPEHPFTRMEIKVASAGTQERRWLRWSIHALYDGDGKLREYQAVGQDVTEGKKLEEALQVAESNLRQMIVSNADGMVVADENGTILFVNPAAERLLGSTSYDLLGCAFEYPLTPGQRQELELNPGRAVRVVAEMRVVETKWRRAKAYLATLRDISELKMLQEELRKSSLVDELTGIYNRRGFSTLARQQLRTAQRMGRRLHLFFMDMDQLKAINDTMGHNQGDRAIRETALVLKATFRESDILGRWGGDEFSVLAMDTDEEGTKAALNRLRQNLDDWNTDTARPYKISLSTGSATYDPESPSTLEDLIARADRSMYEDKRKREPRPRASRVVKLNGRS